VRIYARSVVLYIDDIHKPEAFFCSELYGIIFIYFYIASEPWTEICRVSWCVTVV